MYLKVYSSHAISHERCMVIYTKIVRTGLHGLCTQSQLIFYLFAHVFHAMKEFLKMVIHGFKGEA